MLFLNQEVRKSIRGNAWTKAERRLEERIGDGLGMLVDTVDGLHVLHNDGRYMWNEEKGV